MKTEIYVAIADDHELYRIGLGDFIISLGCHIVCSVDNGRELISELKHCNQLPDICIIDVYMPQLNGIETAKIIKSEYPEIALIAISMRNDIGLQRLLYEAGFQKWILKGDYETLRNTLMPLAQSKVAT